MAFYGRTMVKVKMTDWVTDSGSVVSEDGESGE